MALTTGQMRRVLTRVRRHIEAGWRGGQPASGLPDPSLDGPFVGCFVTLDGPGGLRGCRGVLDEGRPPLDCLDQAAWLAAFSDPRFPPVAPEEAPGLRVEVSLLRSRRRVEGPEAIRPGQDGLLLTLGDRQGFLLPQVAQARGWDAPTFLQAVCAKAGLPPDAWQAPSACLDAFEVEHFAGPFDGGGPAPKY